MARSQTRARTESVTLADVLTQPEVLFVLWAVKTRTWNIDDFQLHMGEDFPIVRYAALLAEHGLLTVAGTDLTLTETGMQIVDSWLAMPTDPSLAAAVPDDETPPSALQAVAVAATAERFSELDWTRFLQERHQRPFDLTLLPLPTTGLVGRQEELNWVNRLLGARRPRICAIHGLSGIGKTTVAALSVRQLLTAGRFGDGVAVVQCDRHEPTEIWRQILLQLSLRGRLPSAQSGAELSNSIVRLHGQRDILVVLDNISPELPLDELIAPLRSAQLGLLLLAQQEFPASIPIAGRRQLEPLPEQDALVLFVRELQQRGHRLLKNSELEAALDIVRAVDRHTLAVKVIAAYVTANDPDLGSLAGELGANQQHAFTLAERAGTNLRSALEGSVRRLPPEVARLFHAFAAFATEEFSEQAAHALGVALGVETPHVAINTLVLRELVERDTITTMSAASGRDRLRLHPLLRGLAEVHFARWPEQERDVAFAAVAEYFHTYGLHMEALFPQDVLEHIQERDKRNIVGALKWSAEHERDDLVLSLCTRMRGFWYNRWYTEIALDCLPLGIVAGQRLLQHARDRDTQLSLAGIELTFAQFQRRLGNLQEADRQLDAVLAAYRDAEYPQGEAAALSERGLITRIAGDLVRAGKQLEASLEIRYAADDLQGAANDLKQLGRLKMLQGSLDEAAGQFIHSLALAREVGDRRLEADVLTYQGQLARQRGQLEEAEARLKQALALMRELGDQRGEAVTLHQLGLVLRVRGDLLHAQEYFLCSLNTRRQIRDRRGEGEALGYLGRIARVQGNFEEAQHYFEESLAIAREVHDRRGEGIVHSQLGRLAWARRDLATAEDHFRTSLKIRADVQDRRGYGADLGYLGQIALQAGHLPEAETQLAESLAIAREVQDRQGEARVLVALGILAVTQDDAEQDNAERAEDLIRQAIQIAQEIKAEPDTAWFRLLLGRVIRDHLHQNDRGRRLISDAISQLSGLDARGLDMASKAQEEMSASLALSSVAAY